MLSPDSWSEWSPATQTTIELKKMVIRRAAAVAWAIMLVSAVGLSEAVNCDTYTDCQTCSDNVNTSGDDCVCKPWI